jgi:DNA-binding response OmpR family regulator
VAGKILIVDDEPNILLSLKFLLQQAGFEVHTAKDGQAALEALQAQPVDLMLLDVMLPIKSGYEVCQAVRANPAWSTVKIIMLTARGREIDREKGEALGADDYITKPFATRDVVARVQAMLVLD